MKNAQFAIPKDNEELDAVPSQASVTCYYDAALQRKETAHSIAQSVTEGVGIHDWKQRRQELELQMASRFQGMLDQIL